MPILHVDTSGTVGIIQYYDEPANQLAPPLARGFSPFALVGYWVEVKRCCKHTVVYPAVSTQ